MIHFLLFIAHMEMGLFVSVCPRFIFRLGSPQEWGRCPVCLAWLRTQNRLNARSEDLSLQKPKEEEAEGERFTEEGAEVHLRFALMRKTVNEDPSFTPLFPSHSTTHNSRVVV